MPFSEFWELYDKKIGKKEKIEKKWNKLNFETQTKIMNHIPEYKIANPDKIFRKNPETYLNNDAWLDELPIKQETDEKKIKLICPEHENQTRLVKVTIQMLVVFSRSCRLILITESEFA